MAIGMGMGMGWERTPRSKREKTRLSSPHRHRHLLRLRCWWPDTQATTPSHSDLVISRSSLFISLKATYFTPHSSYLQIFYYFHFILNLLSLSLSFAPHSKCHYHVIISMQTCPLSWAILGSTRMYSVLSSILVIIRNGKIFR